MGAYFSHLIDVCMTYTEHMMHSHALSYSFFMASLKALVHGFLPNAFVTSSTDTIQYSIELMESAGCRDNVTLHITPKAREGPPPEPSLIQSLITKTSTIKQLITKPSLLQKHTIKNESEPSQSSQSLQSLQLPEIK